MRDLAALRARYERDDPAVQLGGLASNLSRIAWFLRRHGDWDTLAPLFRDSKYFSEWAAPHCSSEVQCLLADVQMVLALWEQQAGKGPPQDAWAEESERWSKKILAAAGLLPQ